MTEDSKALNDAIVRFVGYIVALIAWSIYRWLDMPNAFPFFLGGCMISSLYQIFWKYRHAHL